MNQDKRRKVEDADYQAIRLQDLQGFTIREIAHEFGVSTKYVKKVLLGVAPVKIGVDTMGTNRKTYPCSGCLLEFAEEEGLRKHQDIWTSGGTKGLECAAWVPQPKT